VPRHSRDPHESSSQPFRFSGQLPIVAAIRIGDRDSNRFGTGTLVGRRERRAYDSHPRLLAGERSQLCAPCDISKIELVPVAVEEEGERCNVVSTGCEPSHSVLGQRSAGPEAPESSAGAMSPASFPWEARVADVVLW
jgi:hypothetical protein